jgi:hypothetical protein
METVDIKLTPVESSNIAAYSRQGQHLFVQFLGQGAKGSEDEIDSRRTYRYHTDTPEGLEVFDGFESAESKGSYFAKNLRNRFGGVPVQIGKAAS